MFFLWGGFHCCGCVWERGVSVYPGFSLFCFVYGFGDVRGGGVVPLLFVGISFGFVVGSGE